MEEIEEERMKYGKWKGFRKKENGRMSEERKGQRRNIKTRIKNSNQGRKK